MKQTRTSLERDVIAMFFQLSNKLQTTLDRQLSADGLTIKQFFLMIVIDSFDHAPGFSEIADRFGTSRQNVKQLAVKLKRHGYVAIKPDPDDARFKRLSLTDGARRFWKNRDARDRSLLHRIFDDVSDHDLAVFRNTMRSVDRSLSTLEAPGKDDEA